MVPPDGPPQCDVLFCGEAPGPTEDRTGRCFDGKTGKEYDNGYLPLAGLSRPRVYTTNAMKCLPGGNGKLDMKSPRDRAIVKGCAEFHLYREIQQVDPKIIILMGAVANSLVPGIDLDTHHGIPFEWLVSNDIGSYEIFPMWHPAGGLYDHKKMLPLRTDFIRLKKHLAGNLYVPIDAYPNPDYVLVTDRKEIRSMDRRMPLAIDTETRRGGWPHCLTYSDAPGRGRMIRIEDESLLMIFADTIDQWEGPILLHNALFDLDVLERMGVVIPRRLWVDTMMRAFHLQNQPQGLKVLSYRHLGMEMQDFDDLVSPHSAKLIIEYYRKMQALEWIRPEETLVRDPEGKLKLYRPQSLSTKLKRFFTDYSKNPYKDVFDMWRNNWEDHHEEVEQRLGERWPGKCITHAPFDEVLFYACRDADATLRLWPLFKAAAHRVRRRPEVEWMNTY